MEQPHRARPDLRVAGAEPVIVPADGIRFRRDSRFVRRLLSAPWLISAVVCLVLLAGAGLCRSLWPPSVAQPQPPAAAPTTTALAQRDDQPSTPGAAAVPAGVPRTEPAVSLAKPDAPAAAGQTPLELPGQTRSAPPQPAEPATSAQSESNLAASGSARTDGAAGGPLPDVPASQRLQMAPWDIPRAAGAAGGPNPARMTVTDISLGVSRLLSGARRRWPNATWGRPRSSCRPPRKRPRPSRSAARCSACN